MKFKNINPAERYFDKVTILIAAAAAAYFVYAGYVQEPNAIKEPNTGNAIKPADIESHVSEAAAYLDSHRKNQPPIVLTPTNYVEQYANNQKQPLPAGLLAAVPTIAPPQLAINLATGPIGPQQPPVQVPDLPALTEPEILSARALINVVAPGNAQAAALQPPRDIIYVQGKAVLQLAALVDKINAVPLPQLRHTAIYRIEVQRQEQRGGGPWGEWTDVPRLPIDPLPVVDPAKIDDKTFPDQVAKLRTLVMQIIEPEFYPPAKVEAAPGPAPGPAPVRNPNIPVPGRLPPRTPLPGAPGAVGGPPPQGGNAADANNQAMQQTIQQAMSHGNVPSPPGPETPVTPEMPGAVPASAPAVGAPDAPVLLNLAATADTLPVWFWDDQVKPEYTYRYRARLVIINPLYHLPKQIGTIPPGGRDQVFLASDWTPFKPVTIEADVYFYLTTNNLGGGQDAALFRMYKWLQGHWVAGDGEAAPGATLGGVHPTMPAPHTSVDFGSAYTVVDIQALPVSGDMQVVLMNNSTGELVVHDMLIDEQDPQRKKLEDAISPTRQAVSSNVVP